MTLMAMWTWRPSLCPLTLRLLMLSQRNTSHTFVSCIFSFFIHLYFLQLGYHYWGYTFNHRDGLARRAVRLFLSFIFGLLRLCPLQTIPVPVIPPASSSSSRAGFPPPPQGPISSFTSYGSQGPPPGQRRPISADDADLSFGNDQSLDVPVGSSESFQRSSHIPRAPSPPRRASSPLPPVASSGLASPSVLQPFSYLVS